MQIKLPIQFQTSIPDGLNGPKHLKSLVSLLPVIKVCFLLRISTATSLLETEEILVRFVWGNINPFRNLPITPQPRNDLIGSAHHFFVCLWLFMVRKNILPGCQRITIKRTIEQDKIPVFYSQIIP